MRRATIVVAALAALAAAVTPLAACGRREEPDPQPWARAATSAPAVAPTDAATGFPTSGKATPPLPTTVVVPNASASVVASATATTSTTTTTTATATTTASASATSAAPSVGPASSAAPAVAGFEGTWVFAHFDLDDPATKARWSAIPADAQKEILASAPEARLIVAAGSLRTRLAGVPDKTSTFVVEPGGAATAFVIATSDQGRKEIRLLPGDTMRVLDLDKPGSMATIFRRGN